MFFGELLICLLSLFPSEKRDAIELRRRNNRVIKRTQEQRLQLSQQLMELLWRVRKNKGAARSERMYQRIKNLIVHGADANFKDETGMHPLMFVSYFPNENKQCELAHLLLQQGANPNQTDSINKSTALHYALQEEHDTQHLVSLLLKSGAQPNHQNKFGRTPLMNCMVWDSEYTRNLIPVLVEHGAKTKVRDQHGNTAFTLARRYNHTQNIQTLGRAQVNYLNK